MAPYGYKQLFTLHGWYKNEMYHCASFLLPDKTEKSYEFLLNQLKQYNPKIIIGDFEQAIINASAKIFPNAQYLGCYFHYTKCLWRNILSIG